MPVSSCSHSLRARPTAPTSLPSPARGPHPSHTPSQATITATSLCGRHMGSRPYSLPFPFPPR